MAGLYNPVMPTQATYEDANLILRLYELRRDEKLRQAREWFALNFHISSVNDLQKLAPPGSKEDTYTRMVVSYWEMACSFVTAGVLNQELLFESSGELLLVWERIRAIVPAVREMMKNPHAFHSLEIVGNGYIKHVEAQGPEAYSAYQAMAHAIGQHAQAAEKAQ